MAISLRHYVMPVLLVLAACSKGPDQQTDATVTPPAAAGAADTAAPSVNPAPVATVEPAAAPVEPGSVPPAESNNKLFQARVSSELDPVVINQLHSWTLNVRRADGTPVEDATIMVSGTMPAHAHGMPTDPQVTANLGGGSYKVEGIQFQMGGEWEVVFNITAGGVTDDVTFRITLQ